MKMTRKKAKEIGLEVWGYLRDNPEIDLKTSLPTAIYEKIEHMPGHCPLCAVFGMGCEKGGFACPLENERHCRDYWLWDEAKSNAGRKKYAGKIYDAINAWEV